MNEQYASQALQALTAGDDSKLEQLTEWLGGAEGIAGRYLAEDLCEAARGAARPDGDGGLAALVSDLASRPESVLIAFFAATRAPGTFTLPGAWLGPASDLDPAEMHGRAGETAPSDGDTLAVRVVHPAQGRLGAIRTAAWLQTVLGALGLAAYAHSRTLAPLALCPAFGTTHFLGSTGTPYPVDRVALLSPGPPPPGQLAELLTSAETHELLLDATARTPADLAQQRLTLSARWLQLAASAISTADALVALGIALETITGDETKSLVVERVTKRAAIFLANSAPAEERGDVYYDELKRAKRLYDLRSRAAHGQYDEWAADQPTGDANREEFHRFVFEVALGFRRHARERNMLNTADFMSWWRRAEIEGLLT